MARISDFSFRKRAKDWLDTPCFFLDSGQTGTIKFNSEIFSTSGETCKREKALSATSLRIGLAVATSLAVASASKTGTIL